MNLLLPFFILMWNLFPELGEFGWIESAGCGVKQPGVCRPIAPPICVESVGVFVYLCVAIMLPQRFQTAIVTASAICS